MTNGRHNEAKLSFHLWRNFFQNDGTTLQRSINNDNDEQHQEEESEYLID